MHMHWKEKLYFLNLSSVVLKANKAFQHSPLDLYNLKSEEVAGDGSVEKGLLATCKLVDLSVTQGTHTCSVSIKEGSDRGSLF